MIATLKTLATLSDYGASIVPRARREIHRWAAIAEGIPDPTLRSHATHAIVVDARNAEAVAALAAVAPRRQRRTTVELLVAYQVLVDYVDTLGERVCADELGRGLELGMALVAAIDTPVSSLRLDPLGDDGGYLVGLVTTCRGRLWRLPSAPLVAKDAAKAAIRCAEALAHTHTATHSDSLAQLRGWTAIQEGTDSYSWWEIAAGGNSSIAILALLAAAADPSMTRHRAEALAAAYWPHLCVMSTMLDSLVDYERDAVTGDFSFVSRYPDPASARCGIVDSATNSLAATRGLRQSHTHMMIVCGVAGYYAAAARPESLASGIAPALLRALRPTVTPIAFALRAQRAIGALRDASRAA